MLESEGIIAGSPSYFSGMAAALKATFEKFAGICRQMGDKVGAGFASLRLGESRIVAVSGG